MGNDLVRGGPSRADYTSKQSNGLYEFEFKLFGIWSNMFPISAWFTLGGTPPFLHSALHEQIGGE